jgi:hypothetical protein
VLPATATRVPENTSDEANARIHRQTEANIAYFTAHPDEIPGRLDELDQEWDIERVLETQASSLSLAGLALAAQVDKRFLIVPAVVAGFLLQHALQGWCPPVPVLRRLGIRTAGEIEQERYALKAARGDFRNGVDKVVRLMRGRARGR